MQLYLKLERNIKDDLKVKVEVDDWIFLTSENGKKQIVSASLDLFTAKHAGLDFSTAEIWINADFIGS